MLIDFLGFALPLEWIIGIGISFFALIIVIVFLVLTRGGNKTPIDKTMLIKVPVDEAGIIQRAKILQNIQQTPTDLVVQDPDLVDEEGNPYLEECSIIDKVPIPAEDLTKSNVTIWIGRVRSGVTEIISASQLMGNIPVRYDTPPADAKRLFKPLMPWGSHGSIEEIVSNKNFWAIMIPTIVACLAVGHII